jgi:hypothetical protein
MTKRAALIVAVLVAAMFPSVEGSAAVPDEEREAIQSLLDRRAAAFLEREQEEFLSTIDPEANEFRGAQARMFDTAGSIPFAEYNLVADWGRYGDLARDRDIDRYPGAVSVVIPLVQERYRIKGFDEVDAVEDVFFTFVKRGDEWFIGSDTDLDDVGMYSVRHPWDFGPLITTRSEHFLALGPPCVNDGDLCADRDLLDTAEAALARTNETWSAPWRDKVVLVVPSSEAALQRMLQATFDAGKFVAFAYSTVDPNNQRFTGDRVLVNPSVIAGRAHTEVLQILAHELLHVATRDFSGSFVPLFVDEGLAEVAGYGDLSGLGFFDAIVAAGSFDSRLPEDFQFSTGSGNDIYLSYQEAQSAVRYFIERWSRARFIEFYRRIGRARTVAGLATWHVDRALKQTIGMSLRRFEKAWASSIGS